MVRRKDKERREEERTHQMVIDPQRAVYERAEEEEAGGPSVCAHARQSFRSNQYSESDARTSNAGGQAPQEKGRERRAGRKAAATQLTDARN
jgi:hypothetical protein